MNILENKIDSILDKVQIITRDNSDMAMMGDSRGDTLWSIDNRKELIVEIAKLYTNDRQELIDYLLNRMKAAEDFINFEGQYYATWERKFELFNVWKNLVAQEKLKL